MTDPAVGSVSREFFDVQKLAITQFPAVLVTTAEESREVVVQVDVTYRYKKGVL